MTQKQTILNHLKTHGHKIGNSDKSYGEDHYLWKGDDVGYMALHGWIRRHYGRANKCENIDCKIKNPKKFEWANLSGEYKRDRKDFKMLCVSCHIKMDRYRNYGNKCNKGHEFTEENTYRQKTRTVRACRICREKNRIKYLTRISGKNYKRKADRCPKKI